MAMSAMCAEDRISSRQVRTNARGDGLLTDVRVAGAVHQTPLMTARQLFLADADPLHLPVEPQ